MRQELKKIQAENASLAQRVQAGRDNIAQTEYRISTTVDEWKVRKVTKKHTKNVFVFFLTIIIHGGFCT